MENTLIEGTYYMEILNKYYFILARTKIGGVKVREEGKKV